MSVAAQSPHRGSKRHFERGDSPERYSHDRSFSPSHKRFRHATVRSTPLAERQPYVVNSTTITALKGLFPEMDDKVAQAACRYAPDKVITPQVLSHQALYADHWRRP